MPKLKESSKPSPKPPKRKSSGDKRGSASSPKLKPFLQSLALDVGRIHLKFFQKRHQITRKAGAGIVTEADKAAEDCILQKVFKKFPQSSIITEESGEHHRSRDMVFIVDPLDGTTNYAHGFPWFCVSIGVLVEDKLTAGVIYNPVTKEMFFSEAGRGATLNGKAIRVSTTGEIRDALLGTGFYYSTGTQLREEIEIFGRVQDKALGVRRPGSAALDLAYVACGRYDGFWERGLSSWDIAAGLLLVREAGGRVSDYRGNEISPYDRQVVATNGRMHESILKLISG